MRDLYKLGLLCTMAWVSACATNRADRQVTTSAADPRDDEIRINGRVMNEEATANYVHWKIVASVDSSFSVECGKNVSHARQVETIDRLKAAGARNIALRVAQ